MRMARIKTSEADTWYHLRMRIVGPRGWYPLQQAGVQKKFLSLLKRFLSLYFCEVGAWCLMGSHYHLVVRFQAYRRLSQRHLERLAKQFYPRPVDRPQNKKEWAKFNRRIFDVSAFEANLNSGLATWFNKSFGRIGSLVADRFKSTLLTDLEAVLNCMLYVDLNPVRAGLVERPEDWRYGSAWQRENGQSHELISLKEVMPWTKPGEGWTEYRYRLYNRGAVATKPGTGKIPEHIVKSELARGFKEGAYRSRQRCFSDGAVLGNAKSIRRYILSLQQWLGRKRILKPVPQMGGVFFTLKAQRRRTWELACCPTGPG